MKDNVVFLDEDCLGCKYYNNINLIYKTILANFGFNVMTKSLMKDSAKVHFEWNLDSKKLDSCIELKENSLFVFNPFNFACFVYTYDKTKINTFLDKLDYIVVWQEVLRSNFRIIGYTADYDVNFVKRYFANSKLNLVSNMISLNSLIENNIINNKHFLTYAYSPINNIMPLSTNGEIEKDVDILVYGSIHNTYYYRDAIITTIRNTFTQKKIVVNGNLWGTNLDDILKRTKIVVHIPSFEKLEHMPWAKIAYLQSKKVFFIIEENKEMYDLKLEDTVAFYKSSNSVDIKNKIDFFLNNTDIREQYVENNYQYITKNWNLDIELPKIFTEYLRI